MKVETTLGTMDTDELKKVERREGSVLITEYLLGDEVVHRSVVVCIEGFEIGASTGAE